MKVTNSSPDSWTPQSGAPAADQFRLIGEFGTNQPVLNSGFSAGDAITGAFPGAAAALYGQASTKTNVSSSKSLWLQLEMPTAINAEGKRGRKPFAVFGFHRGSDVLIDFFQCCHNVNVLLITLC